MADEKKINAELSEENLEAVAGGRIERGEDGRYKVVTDTQIPHGDFDDLSDAIRATERFEKGITH